MTTRIPTIEEIAAAFSYLEGQYFLNGTISGEQWAEGLAYARPLNAQWAGDWYGQCCEYARDMRAQLSDSQWRAIAARADYLRASEGSYLDAQGPHGSAPRYTEAR